METTNVIRIPHPSEELVAFLKKTQAEKRERLDHICDKYNRLIKG